MLHENHPGIVRMKSLARMHVLWYMFDQDIAMLVANCQTCKAQQSQSPSGPANPWILPSKAW